MSTPGGRPVAPNALTSYWHVCTSEGSMVERIWAGYSPSHQQSSPELDTEAEVPAIQLIGFKIMRNEIWGLYNEVYQLKRSQAPYHVA